MMTRPSLIPASAPTSPAVSRSRSNRNSNAPATPQRTVHSTSLVYQTYSPLHSGSIKAPYTPQSFHSFSSSNGSTLDTPVSVGHRRLSLSLSPESNTSGNGLQIGIGSKSLADVSGSWRARANENGIRVTSGQENQFLSEYMRLIRAGTCFPSLVSVDFV